MAFRYAALAALTLVSAAVATDSCCEETRTIEAVGVSFADVAENRTIVRLRIFVEGENAFAAINNIAAVTQQATDFLESQDSVFKIRATNSFISASYDYNTNEETGETTRTLVGYSSGGAITYETAELSGDALEGVQAIDGIEFSNIQRKEDYDALQAGQKEALKNAVFEAKVVAEKMLEGTGFLKLGKVLTIKGQANSFLSDAGGESKVVEATATVTYEIYE